MEGPFWGAWKCPEQVWLHRLAYTAWKWPKAAYVSLVMFQVQGWHKSCCMQLRPQQAASIMFCPTGFLMAAASLPGVHVRCCGSAPAQVPKRMSKVVAAFSARRVCVLRLCPCCKPCPPKRKGSTTSVLVARFYISPAVPANTAFSSLPLSSPNHHHPLPPSLSNFLVKGHLNNSLLSGSPAPYSFYFCPSIYSCLSSSHLYLSDKWSHPTSNTSSEPDNFKLHKNKYAAPTPPRLGRGLCSQVILRQRRAQLQSRALVNADAQAHQPSQAPSQQRTATPEMPARDTGQPKRHLDPDFIDAPQVARV